MTAPSLIVFRDVSTPRYFDRPRPALCLCLYLCLCLCLFKHLPLLSLSLSLLRMSRVGSGRVEKSVQHSFFPGVTRPTSIDRLCAEE